MTDNPADEIRAAAFQLRNPHRHPGLEIAIDPDLAMPLAAWLDAEAEQLAEHLPAWDGTRWLATRTWSDPAPVGYQRPEAVRDLVEHHYGHALTIARHINQETT
ncbi:hypothetical protein [Streptomyces axinellae]|uniref:DinB-like domain-containing protein n=1 Tax=Streptomyces axinellae TaxID=552788 RepID=A0ABP6CWE6_9ACTN